MSKDKVSLTAWVVLVCHLILSKHKQWGVLVAQENLAFYPQCSDYCRKHFLACRLLNPLPDWFKLWLIERTVARGAPQHYLLRKQAIAKQVQSSIDNGIKQLVVLGGGFDVLAFNTALASTSMSCFEIDMPGMHNHKMRILRDCYGELPVNFHGVAADLSQTTLRNVLSACPAFNPKLSTLFVAEGLTMYLSERDIENLFSDIRTLCDGASSIILTAIGIHREPKKGWATLLRNLVLSANKEIYGWSLLQKEMAAFLQQHGFTLQSEFSYADLQRPWRNDVEMALLQRQNGEYLVYAVANPM